MNGAIRRILLIGVLLLAVFALVKLDLLPYLTLEGLKANQEAIQARYEAEPAKTLGLFFALYVVATAISIPGAVILTLAAGAFFGVVTGTLVVSFASSLGGTIAFLIARFLFREPMEERFKERLASVNRGLERDGVFYLLALRMLPLVPYFITNLVMGLTQMRTTTFYGLTQLGLLPGTIVYVNAGTRLAEIESVTDIASPPIILSLFLLGALPLAARWAVQALRRRNLS